MMQFIFAPIWGKCSGRFGRRPLLLTGLSGFGVESLFFGIGTSLAMLYAGRIALDAMAAVLLPIASAYVSDVTPETKRARAMAWLGCASGLGVVVESALGALPAIWHAPISVSLACRFLKGPAR